MEGDSRQPSADRDWTRGPAKYAALAVLVLLALGGLVWSLTARRPLDENTPAAALPARKVNVNTADAAELQLLPGIGPALAKRFVTERGRQPFENLEDLQRVKGVGPRTSQDIAPFITFDAPP